MKTVKKVSKTKDKVKGKVSKAKVKGKIKIESKAKNKTVFSKSLLSNASIGGDLCILALYTNFDITNSLDLMLTHGVTVGIDTSSRIVIRSIPIYPSMRLEFNRIIFQPLYPTHFYGGIGSSSLFPNKTNANTPAKYRYSLFTEASRNTDTMLNLPNRNHNTRSCNIILKCSFNNSEFVYIRIRVSSTLNVRVVNERTFLQYTLFRFFFPSTLTQRSLSKLA